LLKGEVWDWFGSHLVRGLAITASLSFILLGIWSYFHKSPLIDLTLFKIRSYTTSIIVLFLAYSSYFGSVVLIPLWLQQNMGYTAEWAGFALAPVGFAPVLFSYQQFQYRHSYQYDLFDALYLWFWGFIFYGSFI
jgi:DHA2 family multidrug resistance protein